MSIKILCLGGGSFFFHEVLRELALCPELSDSNVILFDTCKDSIDQIAAYGRQVVESLGVNMTIETTCSQARAFDGVDYCISSIGVHGINRNDHLKDIRICSRHGILHTTGDTTGPCSISIALRIVPIYVKLARQLVRRSPNVVMLQHSNPMAVINRALIKYTDLKIVAGLCHGANGTYRYLAKIFGIPYAELDVKSAGLNHLLWLQKLRYKGRDLLPKLAILMDKHKDDDRQRFAWDMYSIFGHFPINADRHIIEFFQYLRQARTAKEMPYGLMVRESLLKEMKRSGSDEIHQIRRIINKQVDFVPPETRSPENIGEMIVSIEQGRRQVRMLNVQNEGAIPNLPAFVNVETEAVVSKDNICALATYPIPDNVVGQLLLRAYQYELIVDAAVKRSRKIATQALAMDPMVLSLTEARSLIEAFSQAHDLKIR